MNPTTVPAPVFETAAWIPPSARLSVLALAALEAGVSPIDVRAYLSSRYAVKPISLETVEC